MKNGYSIISSNIHINRFEKSILIFWFFTISIMCYLLLISPTIGYEYSIYSATPLFFWYLLSANFIIFLFFLVYCVIKNYWPSNLFWISAFFNLLILRIIIINIPWIRGYYSWIGDHLTHVGYIKDIILYGFFPLDDFYPIPHIFVASEQILLNNFSPAIQNYTTSLFSIIYFIGLIMLSSVIFEERKYQAITIFTGGLFFLSSYHVFFMPNGVSFLLFPLIFYVFFRCAKSKVYFIILLIFLIGLPLTHVLTSLLLIVAFLTMGLLYLFWSHFDKIKEKLHKKKFSQLILFLILLEGIITLYWIFLFKFFNKNIRSIVNNILDWSSPNTINSMATQLDRVGIHGLDFFELLIKQEGDFILFFGIFCFSLILIYRNREINLKNFSLYSVISVTLVYCMLYTSFLFNILPGLGNIGASRIFNYIHIFFPLFASYVLIASLEDKKKILTIMIIFLIGIGSMISIFGLFYSPIISRPNMQITHMDQIGSAWVFTSKDRDITLTHILKGPPNRFADAFYGITEAKNNNIVQIDEEYIIPDHFAYSEYQFVGQSYSGPKYAQITKMDKITYTTVWKTIGRFNYEDFNKLNLDTSSINIYCNGELEYWLFNY